MTRVGRPAIVWASAAAVCVAGCESGPANPHDHGGAMVDEYRPARPPVERPAPASATVVLWRWEPVPAAGPTPQNAELLDPATRPAALASLARRQARERAFPVDQEPILVGEPVGFRRRPDGLLVAVAGPTTRAIPAGHYCWTILPGSAVAADENRRSGGRIDAGQMIGLIGAFPAAAAAAAAAALPSAVEGYSNAAHPERPRGEDPPPLPPGD